MKAIEAAAWRYRWVLYQFCWNDPHPDDDGLAKAERAMATVVALHRALGDEGVEHFWKAHYETFVMASRLSTSPCGN